MRLSCSQNCHGCERGITDAALRETSLPSAGAGQPQLLVRKALAVQAAVVAAQGQQFAVGALFDNAAVVDDDDAVGIDRKSTRLNSSHVRISYAVFCLKKKKKKKSE